MIEILAIILRAGAPSGFITRRQIEELTGGIIKRQTLSNLDCAGKGIEGKLNLSGRKVLYPVDNVLEFLEKRLTQTK